MPYIHGYPILGFSSFKPIVTLSEKEIYTVFRESNGKLYPNEHYFAGCKRSRISLEFAVSSQVYCSEETLILVDISFLYLIYEWIIPDSAQILKQRLKRSRIVFADAWWVRGRLFITNAVHVPNSNQENICSVRIATVTEEDTQVEKKLVEDFIIYRTPPVENLLAQ